MSRWTAPIIVAALSAALGLAWLLWPESKVTAPRRMSGSRYERSADTDSDMEEPGAILPLAGKLSSQFFSSNVTRPVEKVAVLMVALVI